MNKVLYIILISLFSLTVISCAKKSSTSSTTTDNNTSEMRKTTATCSAVCDGLVLYLPFMGDKTDVNTDNLGNTIDNNTLSVSTDNSSTTPTLASDRDSNENASYRFDGTDDFLQVDNVSNIALESGSFTISMIAKLNNLSQDWITYSGGQFAKNVLFGTNSSSITLGYHTYPGSGSELTHNLNFGVWNGSSWTNIFISTTNPLSYQNIVAVADHIQGVLMLYVNGSLVSEQSWDKTVSSSSNWKLGMQATTAWEEKNRGNLDGWIDEVRVYNRALSADEVGTLY